MENLTSDHQCDNHDLDEIFKMVFRKNSDQTDDKKIRIDKSIISSALSFTEAFTGRIISRKRTKIEMIEEILLCLILKVIENTLFSIKAYKQETENTVTFESLVKRLIACVIVYLASYNTREPTSGQKLVHLDPTDGFFIREENLEKTVMKNHSLKIPFIWSELKKINLQLKEKLFYTYCKNYLPKIVELNSNNHKLFYTTLADLLESDDRTVRRWVEELKNYILPVETKKQTNDEVDDNTISVIENRSISQPGIVDSTDVAKQLLSLYPKPNIPPFREDITEYIFLSKNASYFPLSELSNFSGCGLLIGPPKSGKTTILSLLANENCTRIYIDCMELLKLDLPDLRKYISLKIVSEFKKTGQEDIYPPISQSIFRETVMLIDHFDFLPPTKQQTLLFEIESVDSYIIATTYSIPEVFVNTKTEKIRIIYEQQPYPNHFLQFIDDIGDKYYILNNLNFYSSIGGYDHICNHVYEQVHLIINGFLKQPFEKTNYKIYKKDFEFIFLKLEDIILNQVDIDFDLVSYSTDVKKNHEVINSFNMFVENIELSILDSEVEILHQNPLAPTYSQILRIEDNQLKFQYKEFLWPFIVSLLESKRPGYLNFLGKYGAGYSYNPFMAYVTSYARASVKDRQIFE